MAISVTPTAPAPGILFDVASPLVVSWTTSGDAQTQYFVSLNFHGDGVAWNGTLTTSGAHTMTIPAHAVASGTYDVSIQVNSATASGFATISGIIGDTAPNAPTLGTPSGTDPAAAITFPWTFSDPDTGDSQSAYELLIKQGATVILDTGKVTSSAGTATITGGVLTNGLTYTWQVRTWDSAGVAGPYSATQSFLANSGPLAPTLTAHPAFDATSSSVFAWTYQPSYAGTTQSAYQLQIFQPGGALAYDTGKVTSSAGTATLPANTLSNGLTYTWQVKTWDNASTPVQGPYSPAASVVTSAPPTATITSPANSAVLGQSSVTCAWSIFDPESKGQSAYDLLLTTGADVVLWDSGKVASITARSASPTYALVSGNTYKLKLTLWDGDGVASAQAVVTVTTNFTTPLAPLLTVSGSPIVAGGIVAGAANPPGGTATSLEIRRRPVGGSFIRLATFAPPAQPTVVGAPARVTDNQGRANRAITINTGNTVSLAGGLIAAAGPWTLLAVMQPGAPAAARTILAVQPGVSVTLDATDHPTVSWNPGSGAVTYAATNPLPSAEAWHLFALAWDGANFSLFIDGLLWVTGSPGAMQVPTSIDLGHNGGTLPLNGPLAGASIASRARAASDEANTWTVNPGLQAEADTLYRLSTNGGLYVYQCYFDVGVASGQAYEYKATAVAASGLTADSGITQQTTVFSGVWLHDPAAVAATLYQFQYDEARNETFTPDVTLLQFQGRKRPVAEFATFAAYGVKASLVLLKANGDEATYKALVRRGAVLCYRDARGRRAFGVVQQAPVVDEFGYSTAELSIAEVDFTEGV